MTRWMKKAVAVALIAVLAVSLSSCSLLKQVIGKVVSQPTSAVLSATPAETAAATSQPDKTANPTATPEESAESSPTLSPTASPTPTATPSPTPSPTAAPLTVSVKYLKETSKMLDVKVAYPVISGMLDPVYEKKFNAAVKADLKKQLDQLRTDAKSAYDEATSGGYGFSKFTMYSTVKVYRNDGAILSMGIKIDVYTGGAHGDLDSRYYTLVNGATAKKLTLLSLFTKPTTGKSKIDKAIKAVIAKSPDDYFENPAVSVGKSTWFYLTKTKLHIVYPTYSIAPFAGGEPEFSLPLTSFSSILIADIPQE